MQSRGWSCLQFIAKDGACLQCRAGDELTSDVEQGMSSPSMLTRGW
jgi:hypothetical protein